MYGLIGSDLKFENFLSFINHRNYIFQRNKENFNLPKLIISPWPIKPLTTLPTISSSFYKN